MVITTDYVKNGINKSIKYNRFNVNEVDLHSLFFPYMMGHNHQRKCKIYRTGNGKYQRNILDVHCSFDIETTKIDNEKTFMYGWQFGIDNTVIWGTYWEEFIQLLENIKILLKPKQTQRIICFICNLGYEWQFFKNWLNVTDYFFKEKREPIMIEHDNFIQFRECIAWGGSLQKIANDYTDLVKLKGDLDYSVYRESYNDFKNKREWAYIDFDVLILNQFAKWWFNQYLTQGYIPVTVNSSLRHNMLKKSNGVSLADNLPKTYNEYSTLVNLVYRGGYVHANEKYVGKILHNLLSYDFTSSYPSTMLCEKFPYKFYHVEQWHDYKQEIDRLNFNKYGFYGLFVFENLNSTTNHSIESVSKCKITGRYIEDNGRIKCAEKCMTWLTEQDFMTYCEFYTWGSIKILDLYIGKKEYLPRYLIDEMCHNYTQKAVLKAQGKPYAIEKTYVNMLYGTTVTKEVENDMIFEDGEVTTVKKDMNEFWENKRKDKKNKCVLLPSFGVYISAYSRRNLLKTVYKLETSGNECVYMDTDSIKFFNVNNGVKIIEEYNKAQHEKIKERCKYYNLDLSIYSDLGSFDCEYVNGIENFKTLGAKRYLHTYKDNIGVRHYNCTVAGLPKKCYIERHASSTNNFFSPFTNGMIENNVKLCSNYNDENFTITRLGKEETIKGCLTLKDVDFSLTMNKDWLARLMLESSKERRLY